MLLRLTDDQLRAVGASAARHRMTRVVSAVAARAAGAIQLLPTGPDHAQHVGGSRVGGRPDLPPGVDWPKDQAGRFMLLVLQLNLADLPAAALGDPLPRAGWIWVFVGDDDRTVDVEHRVLYHPRTDGMSESDQGLKPGSVPNPEELVSEGDYGPFEPFELAAHPIVTAPQYGTDAYFELGLTESEESDWQEFAESLCVARATRRVGFNHLFGLAANAIGDPASIAVTARGGLAVDWELLLSLDSDLNAGMCWWDAGSLCFMIQRKDLARLDFKNTYCCLFTT